MSRTFTTRRTAAEDWTAASDLIGRCAAAARMALKGANYSSEDREDVAAKLVCLVWERALDTDGGITDRETAAVRSSVNGGPRVNYSAKNAQKSLDTAPLKARETAVRSDLCAWTFLLQRAANERRALDSSRERDTAEALAAPVAFDPWTEAPADDTGGTPHGARRSAVDMLRALGLMDTATRHGRAVEVAPSGPVWTLAYAAARAIESTNEDGTRGGLDRETVAADLDMDTATVRQHIGRAVKRIPAVAANYSRAEWADALNMPEGGIALKPSRSRTVSADMGTRQNGPREHLAAKDHAPVTVRRSAKLKRASVDAWTRGPKLRPDWTRDLDARTAKRLETAAKIRLERAAAKGDETATAPKLYGLAR